MQRGSRISITEAGVLTLRASSPEFRAGTQPSLHLRDKQLVISGHERVYDLAVAGTRVVALCEGDAPGNLPHRAVSVATLSLVPIDLYTVTSEIVRIAITADAVFIASDDTVTAYDMRTESATVHELPIDFASTARQLAVIDEQGASFYDASGGKQGSVALFAPTAIAVDPIEPGWLVAIDGGVFHLDGPGDTPRLIASCAEPIRKVRRSREATFVLVGNELRAIHDDRVDVLGTLDANPSSWNDFDANADGLQLLTPLASRP